MSVTIAGNGQTTGLVGFRYVGTVYFTSNGSFVKADPLGTGDIGLKAVRVRLVGGGGGGGGASRTGTANSGAGSGGGGGGYAEAFITDLSALSSSESVTVGAAGSGGTAGGNGTAGGTTTFLTLSGTGGSEGVGQAAETVIRFTAGGEGGVGSGGDRNESGGSGDHSARLGTGGLNVQQAAGSGGATPLGEGGYGLAAANLAGEPGSGFGAGGGGGCMITGSGAATRDGGAGAAGVVILDCFV